MAWTEQCKIAFRTSAEHFVNQGQNVRQTLRILSKESGIPVSTLIKWYYKKDCTKTGTPTENSEWPICETCGIRKVKRGKKGSDLYFYPKCDSCYKQEKVYITCPHCGKSFELMEGKHEIG